MARRQPGEEVAPRDADLENHTERDFEKPSQTERFANRKKKGETP